MVFKLILGIVLILIGVFYHLEKLYRLATSHKCLDLKFAHHATFLYPIDHPGTRNCLFEAFTKAEVKEFMRKGIFPLYLPLKRFAELYDPDVVPLLIDLENDNELTDEEMKRVIKLFMKFDEYRKKVILEDAENFLHWRNPTLDWKTNLKFRLRFLKHIYKF